MSVSQLLFFFCFTCYKDTREWTSVRKKMCYVFVLSFKRTSQTFVTETWVCVSATAKKIGQFLKGQSCQKWKLCRYLFPMRTFDIEVDGDLFYSIRKRLKKINPHGSIQLVQSLWKPPDSKLIWKVVLCILKALPNSCPHVRQGVHRF